MNLTMPSSVPPSGAHQRHDAMQYTHAPSSWRVCYTVAPRAMDACEHRLTQDTNEGDDDAQTAHPAPPR